MADPREMLTEEQPESPKDFDKRHLTEVGGQTKADPKQKALIEDLPQEEDEDEQPGLLFG